MSSLQRGATNTSIIDVLDHILDKGIVIDAWVRVALVGIDLITVEARVVVASIETYLNWADALAPRKLAFTPSNRSVDWQRRRTRQPAARSAIAADRGGRKR
jgi:hypothetical protein